jgi:hypothetical protein
MCNSTDDYFMKVNFQDELSLDYINGTLRTGYFYYYIDNYSLGKGYTFSDSQNLTDYYFCFTPTDRNVTIEASLSYYGDGYPERTASLNYELSNISTNITLQLLDENSGIYANYQFIDSVTKQGVPSVSVQIYDSATLVIEKVTDDSGRLSEWLNPNILYELYYTKDGYIGGSASNRPISSDLQQFEMTYIEDIVNSSLSNGLETYFTPISSILESENQTFTFTAYEGMVEIDKMIMTAYNSSDDIIGNVTRNSEGTVTFNLTNIPVNSPILFQYDIIGTNGEHWYFDRYYTYLDFLDNDYSLFSWLSSYDELYYPVHTRTSMNYAITFILWFVCSIGAFGLGHSGNSKIRVKSQSLSSISNTTFGLALMCIVTWLFCFFNLIPFPFATSGTSFFGAITIEWISQYGIFAINFIIFLSKFVWESTKEK